MSNSDMEIFVIRVTNGREGRSWPYTCPDRIFAAMEGQRLASNILKQSWNQESDRTKWKVVVVDKKQRRYEEPARVN
jgi:hypothetical protein